MKKSHKKKVLFFLPFMNGGGAERVTLTLLTHLNREKFEPILVMMKREGRYLSLIPKDIKVVDLEVSQARYALFKIIKVIKEHKPDVVFTTLGYLNLIIALIRPFFSKKITFIARESNTVSVRNKREKYPRLFDWLYKHTYKNYDLIVTQAKFMKNDLLENYQIAEEKMVVIYNPVDSKKIQKLSKLDEAKLPKERYTLLAVGKLGYQKGFDILLSIMTRLDNRYHLTILGEGSDEEALKKQIEVLKLEESVTMAGFCDNPYQYMKEADLLVLPSRFEGLPNVVLEANICGTPVVAFNSSGGTGEIVINGVNGYLVEPFDEEAFADAIVKADASTFDAETILMQTEENYAVDKIIKKYEDIFI